MKNNYIELFFQISLVLCLILYVTFFYYKIHNIYLTYYIVIISMILLTFKIVYWNKIKCYTLSINNEYIFLLKLGVCILIYINPVYSILQEQYLVVDRKISFLTFIIITVLAILGVLIDKKFFKKVGK